MTHDLDEDLENSIAFALAQFPYQPPRTRSTDERRSYFLSVARAVRKPLQFSWTFHKNPPQRVVPSNWKPHPMRIVNVAERPKSAHQALAEVIDTDLVRDIAASTAALADDA